MSYNMNDTVPFIQGFRALQKEHNVRDTSSMIQNKFNMLSVLDHIDDKDEVKKLIKFFFIFSPDKTFYYFFMHYADYYDTMLNVRAERAARKQLAQETVEKKKGKRA